jgi:hypothetical protein
MTLNEKQWLLLRPEAYTTHQLHQVVKNYWCFRDHLCPHHQGLTWHRIDTVPLTCEPTASDWNWVWANGETSEQNCEFAWHDLCLSTGVSRYCFIISHWGKDQMGLKPLSALSFLKEDLSWQFPLSSSSRIPVLYLLNRCSWSRCSATTDFCAWLTSVSHVPYTWSLW